MVLIAASSRPTGWWKDRAAGGDLVTRVLAAMADARLALPVVVVVVRGWWLERLA